MNTEEELRIKRSYLINQQPIERKPEPNLKTILKESKNYQQEDLLKMNFHPKNQTQSYNWHFQNKNIIISAKRNQNSGLNNNQERRIYVNEQLIVKELQTNEKNQIQLIQINQHLKWENRKLEKDLKEEIRQRKNLKIENVKICQERNEYLNYLQKIQSQNENKFEQLFKKMDKADNENNQLKNSNKQLKNSNKQLKNSNQQLKNSNKQLKNSNKQLKFRMDKLQNENIKLKQKDTQFECQNKKLQNKIVKVEGQNRISNKKIFDLLQNGKVLQAQIVNLSQKQNDLQTENSKLRDISQSNSLKIIVVQSLIQRQQKISIQYFHSQALMDQNILNSNGQSYIQQFLCEKNLLKSKHIQDRLKIQDENKQRLKQIKNMYENPTLSQFSEKYNLCLQKIRQ